MDILIPDKSACHFLNELIDYLNFYRIKKNYYN